MMLAEICRIIEANEKVQIEFLNVHLTHEDAVKWEMAHIDKFGRRAKGLGPLLNLTDGGEGSYGRHFKHTSESRQKISNAMRGKAVSSESNVARRQSMLGRYSGRHLSDNWKNKISASLRGQKRSEETKQKISQTHKGQNNPAAKNYLLSSPDGSTCKVKSLKTFCEEHDLRYNVLRRGGPDRGWMVLERTS
jgi:hypothetical protein